MKESKAGWSIELWTNCPYCEESQEIDFDSVDEFWLVFGTVGESRTDVNYEHTCEECGKKFKVTETFY